MNNVYVSSLNHDFDAFRYLESMPHERVVQFHLAGHTDCGTHLIDTHDGHVDAVWELYRARGRPVARRLDAPRVGRGHPAVRRPARGGGQSPRDAAHLRESA